MHRCESWTIKKAECQKIDAFELWCWRRLLRVPRTARRSNQPILSAPYSALRGFWNWFYFAWDSLAQAGTADVGLTLLSFLTLEIHS